MKPSKRRLNLVLLFVASASALFIATDSTPRPTNSSGTLIGRLWNRIGLTGSYGGLRDGERVDSVYFHVRDDGYSFKIIEHEFDDSSSFADNDRRFYDEHIPDYLISAIVTYRWGGLVYQSWYVQNYRFVVSKPQSGEVISDETVITRLKAFTAESLQNGTLEWNQNRAPRWPEDLRAGVSGWLERYPIAYAMDAIWIILFLATVTFGILTLTAFVRPQPHARDDTLDP